VESADTERRSRPPLWPGVLAVVVLSAGLFGVVLLLAVWKDLPVSSLTRDPVGTAGLRWQTGFLYKISLLAWGATTASCLLGAAMWRRSGDARALPAFLLASAALTLVFAVDDVFQLRGELYDHLGLSEVAVFAVYALILCVFAIVFRSTILRTEYVVLAVAVTLFVVWLALRHFGVEFVVQDGVKLVGQLTLLLYFWRTSAYGVNSR
jgi:hypothetical protein